MYFEVAPEEASQNKIADLSMERGESGKGYIIIVPKISAGVSLAKNAENLAKDITVARSNERMDESESDSRLNRPKVEFDIALSNNKVILSGNLSHVLAILCSAKIITETFLQMILSNYDAKLLVDKTAKYILPEHQIDDGDGEEQEIESQLDILREIQNIVNRLGRLDTEKKKEAISLLAQGIVQHTSQEEREEISVKISNSSGGPLKNV